MSRPPGTQRGLVASTFFCLTLALSACGGGGSGNNNPPVAPGTGSNEPPFGLTSRPTVASLNVPLSDGTIGSYVLEPSFPNLSFPAAVLLTAVPGENRLVALSQDGLVRAFVDSAATTTAVTVLDLRGRVDFGGERGLLGLAFDPEFVTNRYLYVHQSLAGTSSPGVNHVARISRFTWDSGTDQVDPASEKIILDVDQPYGNHNAGMIAFGPDGYLYIALGDGGSGGDPDNYAQDPSSLLGSMLRIDVHPTNPADPYDVPTDNPFLGQAGFRPETWAYGLRNPFRFSFDRNTGVLWLGDVGQNAREEINIIEAGGNYGWRVREGFLPFNDSLNTLPLSAFTDPVIDYGRSDGASVIGGYVYRGTRVPSLQGRYLYGDYISGNVWALTWDSAGNRVVDNELIANVRNITAFGEDTAAHVHVVTAGGDIYEPRAVSSGTPSDPPALLSDTGVFTDLTTLTAASGFIEYELNLPFWSDGTVKRRWVAVPNGETVGFDATGAWSFPVGTVVVKHFELALTEGNPSSRRRLETRLLVHREDGWRGFTYRWNGAGSDADLLPGRAEEIITVSLAAGGTRDQRYVYPSRTECLSCHTEAAGITLGLRTRQLNRDFAYPAALDNQLRSWNNVTLFDRDINGGSFDAYAASDDESVPPAPRARAYLAVNCAQCHQPGGGAPTSLDLRFDVPDAAMNVIDVAPDNGDLGIVDARLVAPGDRSRSVLYQRMVGPGPERMPPVGSHVVDETGADLIGRWIDSL